MKSKHIILPLVIAGITASGVAVADKHKKKAKDWTCADFLAIDVEYQPKVVYWASAHSNKGKPEEVVLDIEGTEKVVPMVVAACKKEPKESFWKKLKGEWGKVKKDM